MPPVSVKDIKAIPNVFPNPSDALFFIQMNDIQSISVYSINGQLLMNKIVNSDNYMLDLSEYSKGFYFVKINTPKAEFNHKIILK